MERRSAEKVDVCMSAMKPEGEAISAEKVDVDDKTGRKGEDVC